MMQDLWNSGTQREGMSLLELNQRVRNAVQAAFPSSCWIQAETSDVRVNAASGHCYLEFVEKNVLGGQLVAKARGAIWAKTFRTLKARFERETGQVFTSGLKVLVEVTVDYHELYGFSLTVSDIDPTYTLGDMARRRMEIIRRLQEEKVFDLNKGLPFPRLPQRIAIITSSTAAGYGDFLNQLSHNKAGYSFYTHLFSAMMQGERTEASLMAALEQVEAHKDCFDVAVIIRGGGAASELSCFDSYPLALRCAHLSLPLLTGIGHERDDTVLDMVAHTRMKTPTAVAEHLIGCMDTAAKQLDELQAVLVQTTLSALAERQQFLLALGNRFPTLVANRLERNRSGLQGLTGRLPVVASAHLAGHTARLDTLRLRLANSTDVFVAEHNRRLQLSEQFIRMASPEYILQRGYSLTLRDGQIVKQAKALRNGETITTCFADGQVRSRIL